MEVEAKFSLPDHESLHRFQVATRLAGFRLAKGQVREVRDTYVDTAERKILAGGYACRFRQETAGIRVTLKGVGGAQGAIHTREETEVILPAIQPPEEWPVCPLQGQVLQLTGGDPLHPLFELLQTRIVRPIHRQGQSIAELSLDEVHVTAGSRESSYYELEVELTSLGSEEQLVRIAECLQQKWGLRPEPHSKFERALMLLDIQPEGKRLEKPVLETLARIAARPDWYGLRSRALLALDQGASTAEAGRQVGRSRRTIRRWLAAFHESGLEIFPTSILEETMPTFPQNPPEMPAKEPAQVLTPLPERAAPEIKLPDKPGLQADDTMAEVTRKTVHFQFQHMLYHEAGTRQGQDIEELHDMRVATRRMRAALHVFGDYLDKKTWEPFEKSLQRTGRILGEVRDLDVFWEKTQRYLEALPPERKDELAPLQAVWQVQRDQRREKLIAYLEGDRYRHFKEAFGEFLQTHEPGAAPAFNAAGEPQPRCLRHLAPVILHQRLAAMRAFDEWTVGPDVPLKRLHQLRIASKGLRYALEFMEEVLGKEAKALINELKALQDHLGNLQDAVVASNLLRDFLTWGTWGHDRSKKVPPLPAAPVVAPGVATYLAARQVELQELPATFPPIWARIQGTDFKQNLAAALAVL